MRRRLFAAVLLFVLILCGSCGQDAPRSPMHAWMEENGKIKVLSTTAFIDNLVARIGQDRICHMALIQGDLDPHSYELVKGDDEKIARAHIVFSNGLGLEHGASLRYSIDHHPGHVSLGKVIEQKRPQAILVRDGQLDPHIWLDISLWAEAIDPIVETLSKQDPQGAKTYAAEGALLKQEMLQMHEELKNRLSSIDAKKRFLVTSHDAFHYFTRSYLSQGEGDISPRCKAPEGLSPDGQLSAYDIQAIIDHVQQYQIGVIFSESNVSKDSLRKIAYACKEKGTPIRIAPSPLHADALGPKGSDADDYFKMMRHNVQVLADEWK